MWKIFLAAFVVIIIIPCVSAQEFPIVDVNVVEKIERCGADNRCIAAVTTLYGELTQLRVSEQHIKGVITLNGVLAKMGQDEHPELVEEMSTLLERVRSSEQALCERLGRY